MFRLVKSSRTQWYSVWENQSPRHNTHVSHQDARVKRNRTWFYQHYCIGESLALPGNLVHYHSSPELFRVVGRPGLIFTTNLANPIYFSPDSLLERPIYSLDTATWLLEFRNWSEFRNWVPVPAEKKVPKSPEN
jgi:hypothetical protein